MDGVEATARVVAAQPSTRGIVLTTFDLDEYAFAAIKAGASGFLLKDASGEDVLAAIRAVHAGDAVPRTAGARRGACRLLEGGAHGEVPSVEVETST